MVEIWVTLENSSTVTIPRVLGVVADTTTDPPGTKTEWLDKQTFGDGDTVPSCTTCQVITTEMVCNTGKPPCP